MTTTTFQISSVFANIPRDLLCRIKINAVDACYHKEQEKEQYFIDFLQFIKQLICLITCKKLSLKLFPFFNFNHWFHIKIFREIYTSFESDCSYENNC